MGLLGILRAGEQGKGCAQAGSPYSLRDSEAVSGGSLLGCLLILYLLDYEESQGRGWSSSGGGVLRKWLFC